MDHVFDALAHPRRRYLLYTLYESQEWTLWELARKVAAWEYDVSDGEPTADRVEPVYLSLYHNHVPKLAADGVVDFSAAEDTITPAENARTVLAVLERAGGVEDSDLEDHAGVAHDGDD